MSGERSRVSTTFTNRTGSDVAVKASRLTAPDGWRVTPVGSTTKAHLASGATFTARFDVRAPAKAEAGDADLSARTTYRAHDANYSVSSRASTTVAFVDLAAAAHNVGVTSTDDPAPGDLDGGGSSLIAEKLADQGVTPGAKVSANGFDFTWPDAQPGTPDNVASQGETISLGGQGNTLAVLGTGTSGEAAGQAVVHYTDGTTTKAELGFPNWCCLATDSYGAKIAVTTKGKNTQDGPAYPDVEYRLYTSTLRIDPDRTVAAVTLPGNAAVHVFAMTVGSEEIEPPPVEDGQYSLGNQGSEQALDAPGNTSAGQLLTSPVGAAASQKWTLTRQSDGSYQIKNAGSGLCADVDHSSTDSGAAVVQYSCGSGPNQRWVIGNDGGSLTIKAKHSGLSLDADADGNVVQVTDTGAPAQRWTATPN